ncbi:MAG: helix-turn-helix transcriptional regulator [Thaumarchaeota archaeon]|nr:helix-turn-helix transcriptional regulator [Nitrososphaerota archaeon]
MGSKGSESPLLYWKKGEPIVPAAQITSCPIHTSLGVLGKKWAMLVLRDISMRKIERFSGLLKSINGITPRVLSMRLKELEEAGIIKKVQTRNSPKMVRWNLTEMGWDALPILMSYVAFGSKWYSTTVFADGVPREMNEIYPQRNLKKLYVNIPVDKARAQTGKEGPETPVTWPSSS